jgi:homoserine kinase type II
MSTVYVLWHVQPLGQEDDEKMIGVYSSEEEAKRAITRLASKPGFIDCPDGFLIDSYEVDRDNWVEGYVIVSDEEAL